jgi:hypothetical protein
MIRTRLTLRPGQNGTKRLMAKYGDRLIAVRYHYDAEHRRRLKTVEIIEDAVPWEPPAAAPESLVFVRVAWPEAELRAAVKAAGGRWNPEQRLWQLRYADVVRLGLQLRVVAEASTGRYIDVDG